MSDLKEFECDCEKCVAMCKGFPCRPLPSEVRAMPNDVAARLMIKDGDAESSYDWPFLQAAGRGYEGQDQPDIGSSFFGFTNPQTCTFLTKEGKCELHGKCKPWEGRVTLCGEGRGAGGVEVNERLENEWRSELGQDVLREWKAAHYKEPV